MEVILTSNHKTLGYKDTIITVKGGYGRNYLIPKGIAVVANNSNRKVALENARQAANKASKQKTNAQALAAQLTTIKVVIKAKVGEGGHIFGSVTPLQIAKVLKEQGIVIDYNNITLEIPIKRTGTYHALLTLHETISHTLPFDVVSI